MAETSLMLAKILWHFDLKDTGTNGDWAGRCRSYIVSRDGSRSQYETDD
jgi:hypothetical protein